MKTIKIISADDHPLFLKGHSDTLIEEADFEVVDLANNGEEALEKIEKWQPDVATLDLDMPILNGIEVAKTVLKSFPNIKIILLSMHKDADIIWAAMALAIHGYVFKDDAVNDLVVGQLEQFLRVEIIFLLIRLKSHFSQMMEVN